jgi:hypothetical protein
MLLGIPSLWSMEHKVLSWPLAIRHAVLLQGIMSCFVSLRTNKAIVRISGKPIITSMQLSITLASILLKTLSDFVISLNKVKSNTTVPYIELLNYVPVKPTLDEGTSCLLNLDRANLATMPSCCRCSNHLATSLSAKYMEELSMDTRHWR